MQHEHNGSGPSVGRRIRAYRHLRGMHQGELARAAGVSRTTIGLIENGSSAPRLGVLRAIATALGVGVGDLVDPPTSIAPEAPRLRLAGGEGGTP